MFLGWKIASLGLFGNFMLYGGMIYMMNVFLHPLHEIRGWSLASISYAMGIASLCVSIGTFFFISLSFHFKLRTLMAVGAFLGSLGFFGMSFAENFYFFVFCFALTWSSGQLFGGAIANILVSNWFVEKRGRALGITNIGTSLSGVILPFSCLFLLENFGLEIAYIVLGIIVFACVPLCLIVIRDEPNDIGLYPDGATTFETKEEKLTNNEVDTNTASLSQRQKDMSHICSSFIHFYKDKTSFCISFSYGIGLMALAGMISQLKPALESMGISSYSATFFVTLVGLGAIIGKYFWGWVSDKFNPILAVRCMLLGGAISIIFLFLPTNYLTISLFIFVFGLSTGGMWPVLAALVYYFYGKDNFKKAYQYASIMIALKSFGYILIGIMLQLFGTYHSAYFLFAIILTMAFFTIFFVKKEDAIEFQNINNGGL